MISLVGICVRRGGEGGWDAANAFQMKISKSDP